MRTTEKQSNRPATTALLLASLPILAVGVLICGRGAAAQPACLTQVPGSSYLCDPLDNGVSAVSADEGTGTFVSDGWQVDSFHDRLKYDLGAPMISGTLRFYLRGVSGTSLTEYGTGNAVHRHLVEFWDEGGHQSSSGSAYAMILRAWGDRDPAVNPQAWHPDMWGRLRYTMGCFSNAMVIPCGETSYFGHVANTIAGNWSGGWVEVVFEFGAGSSTLTVTELANPSNTHTAYTDYQDCLPGTTVLRYVYLPMNPFNQGVIDSVRNSVYSHVSFTGTPASCSDPCDDNNPCTEGVYGTAGFSHYCEAGQCTADPVPDGTPCPGGTCLDGTCDTGIDVDAGAPDPDPADAGEPDVLSPDSGPSDTTPPADAEAPVENVNDVDEEHLCGANGGCGGCRTSTATQAANSVWMILTLLWMFVRRRRA